MGEYLVSYWSQITVLLFAFGYIIKLILGFWFKLKEIKYSSLHLERAQVVRELYSDAMVLKKKLEMMSFAHTMKLLNLDPTREEWLFQGLIKQNRLIAENLNLTESFFQKLLALRWISYSKR